MHALVLPWRPKTSLMNVVRLATQAVSLTSASNFIFVSGSLPATYTLTLCKVSNTHHEEDVNA